MVYIMTQIPVFRIWGYSRAEFLGRRLREIGPIRDISAWRIYYAIQNEPAG